jgi:hypothetical protein
VGGDRGPNSYIATRRRVVDHWRLLWPGYRDRSRRLLVRRRCRRVRWCLRRGAWRVGRSWLLSNRHRHGWTQSTGPFWLLGPNNSRFRLSLPAVETAERLPTYPPPEPDCRTRPGAASISAGGQRRLRARCDSGSRCKSLSVACGHSRSRRNSSMRARMVAKSSAARGRVTFPLHRLVSSLVAGGSLAAHRRERF